MVEFTIQTRARLEVADITGRVAEIVERVEVREGICLVYVPHATAAVVINENADPNVCQDIQDALASLIPPGRWRHDRIDDNADAHIKAAILGPGECLPVQDGRLMLGRWQRILLVELDGPRARTVRVTVR